MMERDQLPGATPRGASRRRFLVLAGAGAAALLTGGSATASLPRWLLPTEHPEPRPGIDATKVLRADELAMPHVAALFDAVREIPHIADGIRCYCGCARVEGYRSLLSCYEAPGMAQYCEICQGEARLAHGRWKEGQSLEQIRRAIDARYGSGMPKPAAAPAVNTHCAAARAAAPSPQ